MKASLGLRLVMCAVAASCVVFSVWTSWTLRQELVSTEQHVRAQPAMAAIDAAEAEGNRSPIVTFEPLVVQLYGSPRTKVVALEFLTEERIKAFGSRVLYVRQDHYENEVNRKRYAEFLSALPVDGVEVRKGFGWTVLAMGPP